MKKHLLPTIHFLELALTLIVLLLAGPSAILAAEDSPAANQVVPGQIQFSGNVLTAEDTEVKA
ncbi:MAG: hypothetical protein EXQ56_03275 [Acidobacteria bacterium]|nr:hypothetical protein [Acidobacteriota bacterium]